MIHLLHVNINSISMKNIFQKKIIGKNGIVLHCYKFFFSIWLNRRQLDSHISFCIHSFVIAFIM